MKRQWIPAVGALALLVGSAGTSSAQFFIPFGLGNPVFGGYGGWGGWGGWGGYGGWGYYPGGIGLNYFPRSYGAFTNYGYGWSPAGAAYAGFGTVNNPYYNGALAAFAAQSYYGLPAYTAAPAGISYVAYAGRGSAATAPVAYMVPDQPATVEVHLPADAELYFDGHRTTKKGSDRVFHTPALEKGKSYHYDVRARWIEDGKVVEQTQRVGVYAGAQEAVVFPKKP
jgi:uncharacterized protein (TIGR03000 family)